MWTIVLSIVCASFLTTPILGIPIGIAVYFYSFISKKVVMCLINIEIILIRKRKRNRGETNLINKKIF